MKNKQKSGGRNTAKSKDKGQFQIERISDRQFAFGIWPFFLNKKGEYIHNGIYKDGVLKTLESMGYSKRYQNDNHYVFIKEENSIIEATEIVKMKDSLYNKIKSLKPMVTFDYKGQTIKISSKLLREAYNRQSLQLINKSFLEHLPNHDKTILRDEKGKSYFFFKNVFIEVTAKGIIEHDYSELKDNCIWKSHINQRDFSYPKDKNRSKYEDFINNVANNEEDRIKAFRSAIGYLLFNHSEPSDTQAIILYDEEITDSNTPQGGTGKGIFATALGEMREMVTIDGKKFDPNDRFRYQNVNESTQIFWIDDLKDNLNFAVLNSMLTEGFMVEKKNKLQFFIDRARSPKVLLSSNSIFNNAGKTLKRRQFPLEFSAHYSSKLKKGTEKPVKDEHGGMFFTDDWDQDEWNRFYLFMLKCVRYYLSNGLVSYKHKNISNNKLIQSTSKEFFEWVQAQDFKCGLPYDTKQFYTDFIDNYYDGESIIGPRGFSNWLSKYAESKDWTKNAKQSNGEPRFYFSV